jgi:monovalent cation:H+ antiporter-2, CPA2 family
MHYALSFIQDLAVIMLIAGIVTVLFHRFKQPVVLGYIAAGVIIGPHTPPFKLIHDEATITIFGELGVIFLLFSLGLEFSLRKLAKVGMTAAMAAVAEIVLLLWLGYEIGRSFGWKTMDALFLGAMLAISSTTIIVKALDELNLKRTRAAQIIYGILIVEDILAIAIIALLSSIASNAAVDVGHIATTLIRLLLFILISLVVGILLVPRLLHYVLGFKRNEMLLVSVLGLCFGFCLIVVKLGYSVALGAFLIGAIMAESRAVDAIKQSIASLRDMFSAVFFVTIGLMLDPGILAAYTWPIVVITLVVIFGKILGCGLGVFAAGNDGRTAMQVGMSVAQIGEFSFIIASLGVSLRVTSEFLYPIAVAVSVLTTFFTPYLMRAADPLTQRFAATLPNPVVNVFAAYTQWLSNLQLKREKAMTFSIIRSIIIYVAVNMAFVAAIFLSASYLDGHIGHWLEIPHARAAHPHSMLLWCAALALSMPFLVAIYRRLQTAAQRLAIVSVSPDMTGRLTARIRHILAELVPIVAMVGLFLLVAALSGSILPPIDLLIVVLICAALLLFLIWRWCEQIHAKWQTALQETLSHNTEH